MERCENDRFITDTGELIVERLDGIQFDEYRCNAPSMRRQTRAGAKAAALYAYFDSLTSTIARDASVR